MASCSINHELKLIYIPLPKCGCTFITNILKKYYEFESIILPNENHKDFSNFFSKNIDFIPYNNLNETIISESTCGDCSCNVIDGYPWTITEQGVLRYDSSCKLYNYVMEMTKDKWHEYKKFTIIRNPYDKFISAWKFINKKVNEIHEKKQDIHLVSLREYIDKSKSEIYDYCKYAYAHSHILMYDHLLDDNNELHIDYIGTFENLNKDLCDILLKIGVDKIKHREELEENKKYNVNVHSAYIEHYDDSILEKVNEILQKDFDTFKQYTRFSAARS
jgi:hypothetical protein